MNTIEPRELTGEEAAIGSRLYNSANIQKRHESFRPEDNTSDGWATNYAKVKKTIDAGGLCSILGPHGTGKTQAAVCGIGYCAFFKNKRSLFVKAFDVFLAIREGQSSRTKSEKKEVNKFISPHLLVIDAFEVRGDTPFENRALNHIVDMRYDRMRPTILISNENIEKFTASVGVAFVDRMRDSGGIILFQGVSFRGLQK